MTTVYPSPRDLVARLSDEERIAVDLILSEGADERDKRGELQMYPYAVLDTDAEHVLADLVPEEKRRGYLKTLAMQIKGLGLRVFDCASRDEERVTWEEARRRWVADRKEAMARIAHDEARAAAEAAPSEPEAVHAVPNTPPGNRRSKKSKTRKKRDGAR